MFIPPLPYSCEAASPAAALAPLRVIARPRTPPQLSILSLRGRLAAVAIRPPPQRSLQQNRSCPRRADVGIRPYGGVRNSRRAEGSPPYGGVRNSRRAEGSPPYGWVRNSRRADVGIRLYGWVRNSRRAEGSPPYGGVRNLRRAEGSPPYGGVRNSRRAEGSPPYGGGAEFAAG